MNFFKVTAVAQFLLFTLIYLWLSLNPLSLLNPLPRPPPLNRRPLSWPPLSWPPLSWPPLS